MLVILIPVRPPFWQPEVLHGTNPDEVQTDEGLLYIGFAIEHSLEDAIPAIAAFNDREKSEKSA
jgi:hypothetical protein